MTDDAYKITNTDDALALDPQELEAQNVAVMAAHARVIVQAEALDAQDRVDVHTVGFQAPSDTAPPNKVLVVGDENGAAKASEPTQPAPTLNDIFAFVVRRSQEPDANEAPELTEALQVLERNAMFFEFFLASSTLYPKEDHELADGLLYSIANDRYCATTKTQLHALDTFLRLLEPRADLPNETAEERLERIKMLLLSDQAHLVRGARTIFRGMLHNVTIEYAQIAQSLKDKLELFQPLHTTLHAFYQDHADDALIQLGVAPPKAPHAKDPTASSTDPASADASSSSTSAPADDAGAAPL